ncbi:winged helix-turn-helix domain-containing protein [Plantibacter sp. 2H11-2]|uniref:winged helix-turn-helix domain-containing protein n=1 Tax=Plantibacter sp. 2H11-2 TaxID=3414431 RepID=UPI003CEC6AF0
MSASLSPALARRIALGAQGFGAPQRTTPAGTRTLRSTIDRLGLLQIDSVNVFERSHYLPLFARLGGYDKTLLDRLTLGADAPYLEYWAHEAAFIPRDSWPLFRWRMDAHRAKHVGDETTWASQNTEMLDWVRALLRVEGPLKASEIEHDANVRRGPWWGWSDVKRALEVLFLYGEVVTAGRDRFERRYALAEHVLPQHLLDLDIARPDAIRALVEQAAAAQGVATLADLADYFRIKPQTAVRRAVDELVDANVLEPVTVAGWDRRGGPQEAWLHRDARRPRRIEGAALLSPFDPVVWFRERALRMFGLHYRIEIYTPEPKRVYGYYVLPVLIDGEIVARVDLKSDRQAGVLRVQSAWFERGHQDAVARGLRPVADDAIAGRLAELLEQTARWQGLDAVVVVDRGTLAAPLAHAVGTRLVPGSRAPEMGTTPHAQEAQSLSGDAHRLLS